MGLIRHLGPVEMFECSTCKERYVGPREDKVTKKWLRDHRNLHLGR
ncbi:hypothetical protein [Mycolicibacter kumamotonensis]|nr:hypothetical protein [Mycolicibacter kumamotonensis]